MLILIKIINMGNLCQPSIPLKGDGAYKITDPIGFGHYSNLFLAERYSDGQIFTIERANLHRDTFSESQIKQQKLDI